MLNHQAILIVEDEPFVALDLALAIEDADGEVVGPVARAQEALALLATDAVAGAILDVNLIDGDISPVVEHMMAAGLPFIVQTGVDLPPELAARFPDLIVRIKPNVAARLVAELGALMIAHNARRLAGQPEPTAASVRSLRKRRSRANPCCAMNPLGPLDHV